MKLYKMTARKTSKCQRCRTLVVAGETELCKPDGSEDWFYCPACPENPDRIITQPELPGAGYSCAPTTDEMTELTQEIKLLRTAVRLLTKAIEQADNPLMRT